LNRDEIKRRITTGELRLVIGTEAASEGLNLQRLGVPHQSGPSLESDQTGAAQGQDPAHRPVAIRGPDQRVWEVHREREGAAKGKKPGDRWGFYPGRQEGGYFQELARFEG